ncbi:methyltransferase domain-containing protein, partial [Leptospira sp. SA-E8]|uniref:methyltransferase domain-containing protein n=1 Tax=Leptospira sp. SA-E8 TaxID=3422259 RepID=UPI003EC0C9C5
MSGEIIDLQTWCETPAGVYLLAWEQAQCERAVADIFGYHALQLGLPALDTLAANRMPHRWLAVSDEGSYGDAQAGAAQSGRARTEAEAGHDSLTFVGTLAHPQPGGGRPVSLRMDYAALPFAEGSLDLVTLPHTLDSHPDPHAVLREV